MFNAHCIKRIIVLCTKSICFPKNSSFPCIRLFLKAPWSRVACVSERLPLRTPSDGYHVTCVNGTDGGNVSGGDGGDGGGGGWVRLMRRQADDDHSRLFSAADWKQWKVRLSRRWC